MMDLWNRPGQEEKAPGSGESEIEHGTFRKNHIEENRNQVRDSKALYRREPE